MPRSDIDPYNRADEAIELLMRFRMDWEDGLRQYMGHIACESLDEAMRNLIGLLQEENAYANRRRERDLAEPYVGPKVL